MTNQYTPWTGAKEVGDNVRLPDVWAALHSNADAWNRAALAADAHHRRNMIDDSDKAVLGALESVDALIWGTFAGAAGWTAYSAIATSWCEDPNIVEVATVWAPLALPYLSKPAAKRSARLLNPKYKIADRKLSTLIGGSSQSNELLCLHILSDQAPLVYDMDQAFLQAAPPEVAQVFLAYKPREDDALKIWNHLNPYWQAAIQSAAA